MDKPFIVKSPTKPGPGYVEATPDLIRQITQSIKKMKVIRAKLKKFKQEIIEETSKNLDSNDESI